MGNEQRYGDRLADLKAASDVAHSRVNLVIAAKFPGCDEWHWQRAVAHINGENIRRNDDTSQDAALAADESIRAAWDAYIVVLHAFYLLRDGPLGVLGGRGI